MVRFRNAVGDAPVDNWWSNQFHQIAFSRGDRGFVVINNEDHDLDQWFHTGIQPGRYCDVISGNKEGNHPNKYRCSYGRR